MNQIRLRGDSSLNQSTTAFPIDANGDQTRLAPRRKIALIPGSNAHLTDEIHCLLRRRLRVAGLIALAGNAYFFLKGLLFGSSFLVTTLDFSFHGATVGLMTALCLLLWSRNALSLRALRTIELTFFGSMACFFAYLQLNSFNHARDVLQVAGNHEDAIRLATTANGLRWFILIVLYGTFIPNTWKRCAIVVGLFVLTPLLLTFGACFKCPIMGPHLGSATVDMMVVLVIGAAIAIFGSYKISELQQEAFHARKLGQYQLHRRLGAGGMGEVYLGEHLLLRRACAIKLIRPDQAGDPTNLSRFEREVQAMATLTHWNTVEVYDYGHAADGTFYYVMEYLPGLSLQDLIERHGPLSPGRAIHFLRQVCSALKEAHGIGLIHRDIKPSNVIASQRGGVHDVAKLLDFGLVVHQIPVGETSSDQKLTVQGTVVGSPPYIAPEQARGKGEIDARTDIYSLGAVGYFLLTGQAPFVRDTAMELLVAHIHEQPSPLRDVRPEVPHDLETVILRCLSKDPTERFQDADALDRALADCDAAGHWDHDQAAMWWNEQIEAPPKREPQLVG
ncbi:MAG: serine/threonine protein kinase [Planctomycetes bacterium]|nr:serine/threonine protein kinase [Planctomycetota bacterium]